MLVRLQRAQPVSSQSLSPGGGLEVAPGGRVSPSGPQRRGDAEMMQPEEGTRDGPAAAAAAKRREAIR